MPVEWGVVAMVVAAAGSLIFSSLTYSLRDMSRAGWAITWNAAADPICSSRPSSI